MLLKSRRIKQTLFLSFVMFFLATSFVVAQEKKERGMFKGHGKEFKEEGFSSRMCEKLNLSQEQKEKLDQKKQAHRLEAEKLKKEIDVQQELLRQALESEQFDQKKVMEIHQQVKDLQNKMHDQRLQGILEIREILTPAQFVEFQKMKAEKKEGFYKKDKKDKKEKGKKK